MGVQVLMRPVYRPPDSSSGGHLLETPAPPDAYVYVSPLMPNERRPNPRLRTGVVVVVVVLTCALGIITSQVRRGVRWVTDQDFSFAPGIEVTDVRQVKGLEFDYVLLLDVNAESYADTPESRHLLHIAATRAAHQLWLVCPGKISPVLSHLTRD